MSWADAVLRKEAIIEKDFELVIMVEEVRGAKDEVRGAKEEVRGTEDRMK